jgi:hypothetical protein
LPRGVRGLDVPVATSTSPVGQIIGIEIQDGLGHEVADRRNVDRCEDVLGYGFGALPESRVVIYECSED